MSEGTSFDFTFWESLVPLKVSLERSLSQA